MKQFYNFFNISTSGKSIIDITSHVNAFLRKANINNGILNLSILHTSASLIIQENADPSVLNDLKVFFDKLAPEDENYTHSFEGKDDMPAHIKSVLTQTNLGLSIIEGKMLLGQWQGIYLFEHRYGKRNREIIAHIIGE